MEINKKEVFEKINYALLNYNKPSSFFIENIEEDFFDEYPFSVIKKLKEIEQNPTHHKEGNVFNHTMLTIDCGAKNLYKEDEKAVFMWGLLLHDIGKIPTTKIRKGKITSYNHDIEGEKMTVDFLNQFDFLDEDFKYKVAKIVRWHMQVVFFAKNMFYDKDIKKMPKETDINRIARVAYCDRLGRLGVDEKEVLDNINIFLEKAKKIK
ncbi:MAG: HD domain-containing protein [Lachnospirales bacterium]